LMVDQVTSEIELTDALNVATEHCTKGCYIKSLFVFLTNFLIHRVLTLSPL